MAKRYPRKARPENKIDAAIALIMALGRHEVTPVFKSSYDDPATRESIWLFPPQPRRSW